jgi:hypothetical protein
MHEWVCYILKTCASAIISFFFLLTHVKVKREEASLFLYVIFQLCTEHYPSVKKKTRSLGRLVYYGSV